MIKLVISRALVTLNKGGKRVPMTIIRSNAGVLLVDDELFSISYDDYIPKDVLVENEHRIAILTE